MGAFVVPGWWARPGALAPRTDQIKEIRGAGGVLTPTEAAGARISVIWSGGRRNEQPARLPERDDSILVGRIEGPDVDDHQRRERSLSRSIMTSSA
ncbi:hypothetical protein GCM10011600_27350 [Pseudolysinimonas yzui]|uniref:Uncharacterized protein n=1 Tax=Pseudolysinimonas yzui TaxID=2708254 RepID=A0A8J3GSP8_9MICO|nr:hypothetical protein GCM10011600_27350 [Pseudolysinimonas yzui]